MISLSEYNGVALMDPAYKDRIASNLCRYICQEPERGQQMVRELIDRISALEEQNRELEKVAITDPLTGAYNLRYFDQHSKGLDQHAVNQRQPTGRHFLILVDLDKFSDINNSHGHDAGNQALCAAVDELRRSVRDTDPVCRIGGDEFAVFLKDATDEGARCKFDEIKRKFETFSIGYDGRQIPVRASFSFGEIRPGQLMAEIRRELDAALYHEKRIKGRDVTAFTSRAG